MPNNGQMVGNIAGIHQISQKKVKTALVIIMPGIQRFSANLGMNAPTISWRKNLPTRVPVSTAVRINTART